MLVVLLAGVGYPADQSSDTRQCDFLPMQPKLSTDETHQENELRGVCDEFRGDRKSFLQLGKFGVALEGSGQRFHQIGSTRVTD